MSGARISLDAPATRDSRRITLMYICCGLVVLAVVAKVSTPSLYDRPAVAAWTTVFAAICVQAAPYLVLGVTFSTVLAVFLPEDFFPWLFPRRPMLAVPVAGASGAAFLGCECGSIPVAASLMGRGVAAGPAIAFLLAAPAINPVVLIATSVAFPNDPEVVAARFFASLGVALVVGWVWVRFGRTPAIPSRYRQPAGGHRFRRARVTAMHDLGQSFGLLVIGAAAAAAFNVTVPPSWVGGLSSTAVGAVLTLAVLAVIIAVCSEADAFIAASFVGFSRTAQLAFMVVGPAVDVKLIAMQAGTFGRAVAARLAPLTFVVAVGAAAIAGAVIS